eukprot:TRINITY_DN10286_c0_g1_i1.p1 TRINITY_DN10286_c0_g1~~TRINITY_DN10286_c0_g1_i1.p1  ORF type:complete len:262 (-),score=27.01 TRINITY_DN10286_c0_g1_i1:51-836(-)
MTATRTGGDPLSDSGDQVAEKPYHERRLARDSQLFLFNSVLSIPDLITKAECQLLMDAADRHISDVNGVRSSYEHWLKMHPFERLRTYELGPEAENLSASILWDRVLPFIETELPDAAQALFGQQSKLRDMKMTFACGEPSVNRYTSGGSITAHTDNYHVTINILLSEPGAFTGGGTAFWQQYPPGSLTPKEDPVAVLHPPQGCGVCYNGNVRHAGLSVTSGTRHVYVASFSLHPKDAGTQGLDDDDWARSFTRSSLYEMD